MNYDDLATAMVDWATETVPALESSYGHEAKERTGNFPDVWVIVKEITHADAPQGDGMGLQQIEQTRLALYSTDLMFLVDGSDTAEDAAGQLAGFSDLLRAALEESPQIGGLDLDRQFTFDFHAEAPFVELDDGSRGRRMTLSIVAVEHV